MYAPMVTDAMTAFSAPGLSLEVRAASCPCPIAAVPFGLGMPVIAVSTLVAVSGVCAGAVVDVVGERVALSVLLMLDFCPSFSVVYVS